MKNKNISQIELFVSRITHDDRESVYHIGRMGYGKKGMNISLARKNRLLEILSSDDRMDTYMSINGFIGAYRKKDDARQINCIYVDLDDHGPNKNLKCCINQTLVCIEDAISNGEIPRPTIITKSGRGIHVYYIYDRSISSKLKNGEENAKLLFAHQKMCDLIYSLYDDLLEPLPHLLRRDAKTIDISRLARVPGTINTTTGDKCVIHDGEGPYLSLAEYFEWDPPKIKKIIPPQTAHPKTSFRKEEMAYNLAQSRERFCFEFVAKEGDCNGKRNYLMFVLVNSILPAYGLEITKKIAEKLSNSFVNSAGSSDPLCKSEIRATINCAQRKGAYKIKNETICKSLGITIEEYNDLALSKNKKIKRENAKILTSKKREERNLAIIDALNRGLTQKEVASEIGCSIRTVSSVLANEKKRRDFATSRIE